MSMEELARRLELYPSKEMRTLCELRLGKLVALLQRRLRRQKRISRGLREANKRAAAWIKKRNEPAHIVEHQERLTKAIVVNLRALHVIDYALDKELVERVIFETIQGIR